MSDLKLILVDPNVALCDAFRATFKDLPNVEVFNGYFQHVPVFNCMVSAVNSFGLMDGGVDAAIIEFLGKRLCSTSKIGFCANILGSNPLAPP
jgi:hypothetical protein